MVKRWLCMLLVAALLASVFLVSYKTQDPLYGGVNKEASVAAADIAADTVRQDDNTLTLWYADDALTEYLSSTALTFKEDTGVKVNIVLKDGIEYLEEINAVSLGEADDVNEDMPDLYITSHDNLLKGYLAGLSAPITDTKEIVTEEMFPETALNAVCCYDNYVAYPMYYETNFLLYNKTYMASIAQGKLEEEADTIEATEAESQTPENTEEDGDALEGESSLKEEIAAEDEDVSKADTAAQSGSEEQTEENLEEYSDPMGQEEATADAEVLERLSTMIPQNLEDIKTFANNYNAPDAVESVFKWDVTDIFYNYFFVGNYMEVGGEHGDNAAVFNIYNSQSVECLKKYQEMNQFFSIDTEVDSYDKLIKDFIDGKMVFTVATTDAIA